MTRARVPRAAELNVRREKMMAEVLLVETAKLRQVAAESAESAES